MDFIDDVVLEGAGGLGAERGEVLGLLEDLAVEVQLELRLPGSEQGLRLSWPQPARWA